MMQRCHQILTRVATTALSVIGDLAQPILQGAAGAANILSHSKADF